MLHHKWIGQIAMPPNATFNCNGGYVDIYGRVYEPGITNFPGQGFGLTVEFGYHTADTDPSTWTNWSTATYNTDTDGGSNDEYNGIITGINSGTYYYTFRYKTVVVIMFMGVIMLVEEVFGMVLQM